MILKDWLKKENVPAYKLAAKLDLSPAALYSSMRGVSRMSPKLAVIIEEFTKGEVSRTEAIWPEMKQEEKDV